MTDLISRQAAIDAVNIDNLHRGIVDALQNIISELPTIETVKHGKWKSKMLDNFRKYEVTCSECGEIYIGNYDEDSLVDDHVILKIFTFLHVTFSCFSEYCL